MALSRERKGEILAEYAELVEQSEALIFTEYRGMTNKEISELRNKVREASGIYRVAKLTLLKKVMDEAGMPVPEDLAGVPIGVGFCVGEVPAVAKTLTEAAEDSELFQVRGGVIGNTMMSMEDVQALADLPPIEHFHAQILGLLSQPGSELVGVLQAANSGVVNVLQAGTTSLVNIMANYAAQGEAAAD